MFDVGWTEMLVIAVVMIVVVGPKDLPNMLRTFGRMTAKMRGMATDFRRQFDEALKEAELDDVKKSVDQLRGLNPMTEVRKQLNPFEKAAADLRAGVDQAMKPKPAPVVESADAPPTAAEPLKNGATAMPGVAGPEAMPAAPVFPVMTDASVTAAGAAASATASARKPTARKNAATAQSAKPVVKTPAKPAAAKPSVKIARTNAAASPVSSKASGAAAPKAAKTTADKARPAGSATVSKTAIKAKSAKAAATAAPASAKAKSKTAPATKAAAGAKTARAK